MRILYVSSERLDKSGGTPLRMREIAGHWARMGHEVAVMAPRYGGSRPEPWPVPLALVPLPKRSLASFATFELALPITAPWLAWRRKADVVISLGGLTSPVLHSVLRTMGKGYAIEVNGVADVEVSRLDVPRWFASLYGAFIRAAGVYRHADRFICVAHGIQEELTRRWPPFAERSVTIGNGVDTTRFRPQDKQECRRRIGLELDPFVFGFVGLLCPWHGTEDLLTATRLLKARGRSGFKTVVVGGGDRFEALAAQIARDGIGDVVMLTGRVPSERVPDYTGSFDVACQVHNDPVIGRLGNSMKFWEYLASGLPVIVSDMSETSRHVRAGRIGWKFRGGDPEDLASKMEYALDHRHELPSIGSANRAFVEEGHTWEAVAREMAEVLRGLARPAREAR